MIRDISIKNVKPLFYNKHKQLIVAMGNKIFSYEKNTFTLILVLPAKLSMRILTKSKLFCRLLRYGVMTGIEYSDAYYLTFGKNIYKYDLKTKVLTIDFTFGKGRGPLNFTVVKGVENFEDGIYFGEYIGNSAKKSVKVYRRTETWSVVYSFPDGEINHVHSLVVDKIRKQLWLLAGDFGSSAAIYAINDNFKSVVPIVSGKQKYRACVAFPTEAGLLYATDTQKEFNSIRLLKKVNEQWVSIKLYNLNGSCIYGCETLDYFVFSTATEPTELIKNKLLRLLDNKPGPGIKSNMSEIVVCDKSHNNFKQVYSVEKDIYPFRLFQFGAIMFPSGVPGNNELYAYSIGGKNLDLSTVNIPLPEIFNF
ncbi:hypothetical protein H5186_21690 [Pseudoalteromonas sp. SG41-2]|uniref:hypothetical protein n=1 Tax=Pseudoalteromonas sp. SG41-2 TaxID=2760978 RepID=UPI001602C72F|nr:hypothetical protein [Pseudoalteromonas sp. SG41-2]MBB1482038.1 hypothetical protein [Pseudoalteromonas sp. SG41-2]